jgi:hypothetical protein
MIDRSVFEGFAREVERQVKDERSPESSLGDRLAVSDRPRNAGLARPALEEDKLGGLRLYFHPARR